MVKLDNMLADWEYEDHYDNDDYRRRDEWLNETFTIYDVACDRETPKAIHVLFDVTGEMWVPMSMVHSDSEVYKEGQTGKLVVVRWWAEKAGLVEEE